jgi:hypothetical protein
MMTSLLLAALMVLQPQTPVTPEPDGSRTVGIVPPFRGEPAPPTWLRATSHARAAVDCRHYLYEAYAGPEGRWLVRYVMFPEAEEAFREIEQAFLFGPTASSKPQVLKPSEVTFEGNAAAWKGKAFTLVDRRDLMKP